MAKMSRVPLPASIARELVDTSESYETELRTQGKRAAARIFNDRRDRVRSKASGEGGNFISLDYMDVYILMKASESSGAASIAQKFYDSHYQTYVEVES